MKSLNCITKLNNNWFGPITSHFEMKAKLPGVGTGTTVHNKGLRRTAML